MGRIFQSTCTTEIPPNATIDGDVVVWAVKGKKRTGKLTGKNRVLCESEIWTAEFVDETGKARKVSTKTKDRASALRVLAKATRKRKYRKKNKAEEHVLIYRLLVGTGLWSTELSLVTPSQFDFERNRFTVLAATTKNKRPDVLPIRPELAQSLKEWIDAQGIGSRGAFNSSSPIFRCRSGAIAISALANDQSIQPDGFKRIIFASDVCPNSSNRNHEKYRGQ